MGERSHWFVAKLGLSDRIPCRFTIRVLRPNVLQSNSNTLTIMLHIQNFLIDNPYRKQMKSHHWKIVKKERGKNNPIAFCYITIDTHFIKFFCTLSSI